MNPHLANLFQYTVSRESISIGESGANVERLIHEDGQIYYLKTVESNIEGSGRDREFAMMLQHELRGEAERLEWFSKDLPVPKVINYSEEPEASYLVTLALPGQNAADLALQQENAPLLIRLLAHGLRQIHTIPIEDCPFDEGTRSKVEQAVWRVTNELVDHDDLAPERRGQSPTELITELLAAIPGEEDVVVIHGDYCLPNILVEREEVSGFVDWGRAGVGDRYMDLALARRSIIRNCGYDWVKPFFEEYGLYEPNEAKLDFFQLLDEFF